TVTALNDPPVARDDAAATANATAVTINVLANDADPEGTALSVETFSQGANGAVTRSGNNLVYTPTGTFSGTDSFTYTAQDAGGATSNAATVSVSVAAPSVSVDLDISRMTVSSRVRLSRNQSVGITVQVNNGGRQNSSRTATVTGSMNGVEVYRQSLQVSDPVGGKTTNFTFPNFQPTITGTINWRCEIIDDDPDVDVATAVTDVQP
ncbi:MAG TPA: Ig-like domain-containing protein, partial [Burkholderiales bacterium]